MKDHVTVKVPGKVMLAGEYGVLRGGAAAACTINHMLTVQLAGRADGAITIESDLWDEPRYLTENTPAPSSASKTCDPLVDCVRFCAAKYGIWQGHVKVTSKLDLRHGVGSSSALRLGTMLAFASFDKQTSPAATERWDLARDGFLLQQKMQSFASGYDLATQNLGGLVVVRPLAQPEFWPGCITRIGSVTDKLNQKAAAFVGGRGAPTGPVARDTIAWADQENLWPRIIEINEQLIEFLVRWLTGEDLEQQVYQQCFLHREVFRSSPHYPSRLCDAVDDLPGRDERWSYKTTGAGGEDAILVLGAWQEVAPQLAKLGWEPAPFHFHNSGAAVSIHKRSYSHAGCQ